MAHYLVTARPITTKLKELRAELDQGKIKRLRPFGNTLHHSLMNAKLQSDGTTLWEEEDYCSPPLAQERAAVLDHFFSELSVKAVSEGEGWGEIEGLPNLWDQYRS
jgi:hypothetical protein